MYLKASLYLYSFEEGKDKIKKVKDAIKQALPGVCEFLEPKSVSFEAMYWRKANHIHKWFVDNVQDGEDNCGTYYVDREKLEELYKLICDVLKFKGKKNANEKADELMPTTSGFFFGGTEYDEYYWQELEDTKVKLRTLLDNPELKEFDFDYHSSW